MSSPWIVMRPAMLGAAAATLVLSAMPVIATMSLDELEAANLRAWNEHDAELIGELHAPDAVHTATFYDRTLVVEGAKAIATAAGTGQIVPVAPRIDIAATEGHYRWADFIEQDCLLPENSMDSRPRAGLADAGPSTAVLELTQRLSEAWAGHDPDLLAAVYAPDAVHSARFTNETKRYAGPAEILEVASVGGPIQQIGTVVEFQAPERELAWAQVTEIAGGTLCLFRAVDGMVTRHDCVLPVAS
jgi:hypothetical protein